MRFQQTKDGMCHYFFFFLLRSSMPHRAKTGPRYCGIYSLNTHLHKRKCRVGGGERQTRAGGEMGRRNERRKKNRKKQREKTQREREMMEGRKLIQGIFFFFIKFQPKEAVYTGSPFSPSEARRQTKMLCQLQKKSMKILFGSPFHHSARMVPLTF